MLKRIIVFSTAYLPLIGGAEIAVREITERLSQDYEVDLICARLDKKLPSREKIGRVNVYRLGRGSNLDKYLLPLTGFLKASFLNKHQTYNLIWSIMASQGGLAALFFKLRYSKIPFLLTLQEGDSKSHIRRRVFFIYPIFKMIFKKADYIQAISNYLAQWGRENSAECPIEVVPNGVDIEKFKIQDEKLKIAVQDLKLKLDIKPDEKVIITASRLAPKNGLDDLISATRYLDFHFKLLIIGAGVLRKKLETQAARIGLKEKIIFLGNLSHNELPIYLNLADVFVRPSLSEGLGNAFLEAMSVGLPVIGTPVGGIPDFLKDGQTGLFCQVKNPQDIAEKIKILLSNEGLRDKIIINGKKLVTEKYNWTAIAARMERIFNFLTQ